jgi:nucleoside phosphorylase
MTERPPHGGGEAVLSTEQRRVLDAMLKDILDQPASGRLWVPGRELRFALGALGRERADAVISSCVPNLITANKPEDQYFFGLDGLLATSDPRPGIMLSAMLSILAARYREPGGRRQRALLWSDVRRAGTFSAVDFDIAYLVFITAQLGNSGRPPQGASHDQGAPTHDYEFWIREQDLEAMVDHADASRWAKLQRERRVPVLADRAPEPADVAIPNSQTTNPRVPMPSAPAVSKAPEIDLAVITILPEEYQAVLACLDSPQHVRGVEPNLYSWKTASVRVGNVDYSVVIALAGDPTNPVGALVTQLTVERFKPRYIVVLGIAGGFPAVEKGVVQEHGDVVISKIVHGYEYGKITREGYQPRGDFTHRADIALVNAATAFISSGSDWWSAISGRPPRPKRQHHARVGEVASGDKVVDDPNEAFFNAVITAWPKVLAVEMEGAGAALAIEVLHGIGYEIGFVMIRGISDMPGTSDGAGTSERDAWKRYAAESAARFLFALLHHNWPVLPLTQTTGQGGGGVGTESWRAEKRDTKRAEVAGEALFAALQFLDGLSSVISILVRTRRETDDPNDPDERAAWRAEIEARWGRFATISSRFVEALHLAETYLPDEAHQLLNRVWLEHASIKASHMTYFATPGKAASEFFREGFGPAPEKRLAGLREECQKVLRPIVQLASR